VNAPTVPRAAGSGSQPGGIECSGDLGEGSAIPAPRLAAKEANLVERFGLAYQIAEWFSPFATAVPASDSITLGPESRLRER